MPRKKRIDKMKPRELTMQQFMDLWCGGGGEAFESPFLRRAAYFEHREELMEATPPGMRPAAFFDFEASEPRRVIGREERFEPYSHRPAKVKCSCGEMHMGYSCILERDEDYLRRLDLLTPEEEAELAAIKAMREANK